MLPKTLNHYVFVERDHLKNVILKFIEQLTMFNEKWHTGKSITFKTSQGLKNDKQN
jgi:hypothetical protein